MAPIQTLRIPVKELSNGDTLSIKVFRLTGDRPGPHVHIQSSVHGAEVQGNAVIYRLIEHLNHNSFGGSISFIPNANPWGLIQKSGSFTQGRFNPMTGDNWNRNYVDLLALPKDLSGFDIDQFASIHKESDSSTVTLEFKKALVEGLTQYQNSLGDYGLSDNIKLNITLQKLAAPADIVLDLHTGPEATRYLYSSELTASSSKYFKIPFTLIYPNQFAGAMDEATQAPWWRLEKAFHEVGTNFKIPFESYTVELGSQERIDLDEAQQDCARIINYLNYKGMQIENPIAPPSVEQFACYLRDYKSYYAPKGGLYQFLVRPGDRVQKGDALAKCLNLSHLEKNGELSDCLETIASQGEGIVINYPQTAVLSEGSELLEIMENPFSNNSSDI